MTSKFLIYFNHKRKMEGKRIEDTTGMNHENTKVVWRRLFFVYFVPFVVTC